MPDRAFHTGKKRKIDSQDNQLFTTFWGLPARNFSRLSTAMSIRRWRDSFGAQEMWGVMMQFFG